MHVSGAEIEGTHQHRRAPRGHGNSLAAVWQKENRMTSCVVLMAWELNVGDHKPDTSLVSGVQW